MIRPYLVTGVTIQNHFEDNEVPVSVMANDLLTTYKYGWKTSYYQNTNDLKSDEIDVKESLDKLLGDCSIEQEEDCESLSLIHI